jgi:HEAT repeat protein
MTRSPYKLLDYYRFEDADLFFGREEETRKMVGEILSSRLLVLFSPSGSGKTSLINAGVRPELEKMGYKTIYTRMEDEPILSVCKAVAESLDLPDCREKEELYEYLKRASQSVGQPLVIFLDQFEEFFIVFRDQPKLRQEFVQQVARIKYDDQLPVFLVLSLREDYFANLHEFRQDIPSIFQDNANIRLEPFDEKAARRAIEKPLATAGWTLAPALVDALVNDLNKEGIGIEPIRLQMVCGALWEQRSGEPGEIPLTAYEALGGAETIIRKFIAGRLEQVPRRQHKLMVRVCEALKTQDNTKRYRSVEDLQTHLHIKKTPRLDAVLRPLVDLQVLREEEHSGILWYEFKHDYVAAELSRWIQNREERTRRRQSKVFKYVGLSILILFLAFLTYFFIMYNTFYAGFSSTSYLGQQEEIIISRGFSFSGQSISTGLLISDVKGYEEINKLREKFRVSFLDRNNWQALADTLTIIESEKFLYRIGERQLGIERLIQALSDDQFRQKASDTLSIMGKSDQNVSTALIQALKDKDHSIRYWAAKSLGDLGKTDQNVIAALLQALEDKNPQVRYRIAMSLGILGKDEPKVIAILFQNMKDKSFFVQQGAATSLANLGKTNQVVIVSLLQALKDSNYIVRYNAAYALGRLGKVEQKVIDALLQALKDKAFDVRDQAAKSLGLIGKSDRNVIAVLITSLRDKKDYVRRSAAESLGLMGKADRNIIAALIESLSDEKYYVRQKAAESLGSLGKPDKNEIDALFQALKDINVSIQASAALVNFGKTDRYKPNVINGLLKALKDKEYYVRRNAAESLGRLGKAEPKVIDALLLALKDEYVRRGAAEALVRLGKVDYNVISTLFIGLKDVYPSMQQKVAASLGILKKADQSVIDTLFQVLLNEYTYIPQKGVTALFRLGIADRFIIDILVQAMKESNEYIREQALDSLVRIGKADQKVIDAILQAIKDEKSNVRKKAINALGRLWQNKSEAELITMLEDTRSEIRTAAAYVLKHKKSLSLETLDEINRLKDTDKRPWVRLGAWKAFELIQLRLDSARKANQHIAEADDLYEKREFWAARNQYQEAFNLIKDFIIYGGPDAAAYIKYQQARCTVRLKRLVDTLEYLEEAFEYNSKLKEKFKEELAQKNSEWELIKDNWYLREVLLRDEVAVAGDR